MPACLHGAHAPPTCAALVLQGAGGGDAHVPGMVTGGAGAGASDGGEGCSEGAELDVLSRDPTLLRAFSSDDEEDEQQLHYLSVVSERRAVL